ncbi:MAG: fibronectin type III domain-containing protein, partial [Acidimicrobiia bacterium]|nr:fibronectin type III domain-containing protein [Acidimicrobiia bacterium]
TLTLPNGWELSVLERVDDRFVVALADNEVPVFAGPVLATGIETSSVSLSWPAAVDSGPITYDVAVGDRPPFATIATSTVVTALAPDEEYTIRVTARDDAGNAAAADPVVVRTLSARGKWVLHDPASGRWTFRLGEGIARTIYFGVPGDVALFCDWNGDGTDTVGLYRPYEGFVYLRNSNTLGFADLDFFYGIPTDLPVCGDWDGDGTDTIGVYRPATGRFFLRNSNTLGFADVDFALGDPDDRPLAGDWNGDGIDTVAVWRPSAGTIHGIDGELWPAPSGGKLIVGDYSGNGRDGFAASADDVITIVDGAGSQQVIRFGTTNTVALTGWWD